jgi:chemotaxis signal transduction protein
MPEFLLFRSGTRDYALPAGAVWGVCTAAPTVPLPYAPAHIEGLTGIFDRLVPQQSLMARLGLSGDSGTERTLILVDDGGGGTALRIAAVDKVVTSRTTPRVGRDNPGADAIFRGELTVGRRTYQLVEPEALRFAPEAAVGLDVAEPVWSEQPQAVPVAAAAVQVLAFDCGAKRFAAPFGDVERMAVMPSVIHPVQAPKPILGRSRDDSSLVVSLAGALGMEGAPAPEIVVVVSVGSKEVAFTADGTAGLQDATYDAGDGHVLTLADGTKAELLDLKALADRFARPAEEGRASPLPLAKRRETPVAGRTRLMTIRVNESWYGLSADLIRRVGAPTGYARLYGDNRRFDGIAILGGDAVPAIDLHRVFQAPRRGPSIAVVMSTRDGTVALMCDTLGRLEEVQTDRVEASSAPFIAGRISRSTQTIDLIDLRRIVQQGGAG